MSRPYYRGTAIERFMCYVKKDGPVPTHRPDLGPCWLWTGAVNKRGYGRFDSKHFEDTRLAHRWLYIYLSKAIQLSEDLDHLCRVHACVNPDHLEPVTHLENVRRGQGHGNETHCPQGHPYADTNLILTNRGDRLCRICQRKINYRTRQRQKERAA